MDFADPQFPAVSTETFLEKKYHYILKSLNELFCFLIYL